MERAERLIEKLRAQLRAGEPTEQLLTTLRVLYAEIRGDVSNRAHQPQTGSVAVILPAAEGVSSPPAVKKVEESRPRVVQPLVVDEKELEAELHAIRQAAEIRNAASRHHLEPEPPEVSPEGLSTLPEKAESLPAATAASVVDEPASLNDRLASREREVSESLADEPVQDLRKAVSLNDRFRYVNELFQGDHDLYDKAVRALNASESLGHAMRWIRSEGLVRMGWKEEDEVCAQFISLVRRRFS